MLAPSDPLVKCEVRLTHTSFYPGDAVEGAVVVDAASAFDLANMHIKIVGKEEVNALVDQVSQSKIKDVQFGIRSQDYVYYREIVTLAGGLLTRTNSSRVKQRRDEENEKEGDEDGHQEGERGGGKEPISANVGATTGNEAAERSGDDDCVNDAWEYNESICARPGVVLQNRSFAVSQRAAEEGVAVRFPAGHYVYPFRFLLPPVLPPSYDTGIRVKDGQFSNSQAALRYYVKVYVWSPSRDTLADARADFCVGAMQPEPKARSVSEEKNGAPGNKRKETKSDEQDGHTSQSDEKQSGGMGASRARLPVAQTGAASAVCVFPVLATCSCFATSAKLKVTFTLRESTLQIGRDAITVACHVDRNTSSKALRGMSVQLIQQLTYETAEARVAMRKVVMKSGECKGVVEPGASGDMTCCTAVLTHQADLMPTMQTAGLGVAYVVRVELVAPHIDQAYYEFEGVELRGAVLPGAVPPVGPMQFTPLPRGRLTKREAYYAIPTNPSEMPQIALLEAPLSRHGSRVVSRRTSRLNSAAPTPL